jgi:hypothetical protein
VSDAIGQGFRQPDLKARILALEAEPLGSSPEQMRDMIRQSLETGSVVDAAKIVVDDRVEQSETPQEDAMVLSGPIPKCQHSRHVRYELQIRTTRLYVCAPLTRSSRRICRTVCGTGSGH